MMKKLFFTLFFLFLIYLGIQFAFSYFGKGENYSYEIEKDGLTFGIDEVSSFRVNGSYDNYYYKVHVKEREFAFQTNHDFNKLTQVIDDIEYFKSDTYECLLPIFKDNQILMDMVCYKGDTFTYYYNLRGENTDLDHFANGIALYDASKWKDDAKAETLEKVEVYRDNLLKGHYIGFTNYRGIYDISPNFNSLVYNIGLYKNDVYNQKIGQFVGEYYLSADYNEQHEFNKFNVVDLVKLDTYTITSNVKISLDSYIQGVVDNKVYLYDKDNKKQYEIDVFKQTIVEIGATTLKYYNGEWTTMTMAEANNELKFITTKNEYQDSKYVRIDKIGDKVGYYYLYEKIGNEYKAYRMNIQDKSMMYLFTTASIDNICYVGDFVYFVSGSNINVFNEVLGVKRVVSYSELQFNKNINLNVYMK